MNLNFSTILKDSEKNDFDKVFDSIHSNHLTIAANL